MLTFDTQVVITLGRSVSTAISGLREPRRKLHEDHCGKRRHFVVAPEELRPKKKAKIMGNVNNETPLRSTTHSANKTPNFNDTDGIGGERPGYKALSETFTSAARNPTTPFLSNDHIREDLSRNSRLFATDLQEGVTAFGANSLRVSKGSGTMIHLSSSRRASLPIPSSPLTNHSSVLMAPVEECLHKPNNSAQKGSKGPESPASSPIPKRLKLTLDPKLLQGVPCAPQNPTPASNRSRRTTSSPAVLCLNSGPSVTSDQMVGRPRVSNATMASCATNPSQVTIESPAVHTSHGSDNERSNEDSVDMVLTSTLISNQQRLPANKVQASESLIGSHAKHYRHQNDSILSDLDGSADVPERVIRPRSSARFRSCLPKTESGVLVETPSSSVDQSTQETSIAPQDTTRIVFHNKDSEASSATVRRRGFEGLQLPGSINKDANQELPNNPGIGAAQKSLVDQPFVQKNKYVTENHPSVKARRKAEAAAIAAASPNAASPSTEVAATPSSASTKLAPKKQRKSAAADQGQKPTTTETPAPSGDRAENPSDVDNGLPLPRSGASIKKSGAVGGKIILTPRKERKPPGGFSRKMSNAALEQSKDVKAPPKTELKRKRSSTALSEPDDQTPEQSGKSAGPRKPQSKSRSGCLSSTNRGNTASEGSEMPKTKLKGKNSVSSRELKELLPPHKGSMIVDVSLGSSFKEETKKLRSSRIAPPAITDLLSHDNEARTSETEAIIPSAQGGVIPTTLKTRAATGQASGLSRKTQTSPRITSSSEPTERQVGNANSNSNQAPSQSRRNSTASSSKSINLPKAHVWPVASPSGQGHIRKRSDLEAADRGPKQLQAQANQKIDSPDNNLSATRNSRGYNVNSEGKKMPSSRKSSVSASAIHAGYQDTPSRKTPSAIWLQQDESDTTSAKSRVSVSQIVQFSPPAMPMALRKRASTASATNRAAPPSTPKVSVPNTSITFPTPAPASGPFAPTPASQSRSQVKRKAGDISSPSGDNIGTSTRFWNPTSMCDGSVLGYATGEAFPGTTIDPVSKNVCRIIKSEREGVFRASGVLMGVRFVVGLV